MNAKRGKFLETSPVTRVSSTYLLGFKRLQLFGCSYRRTVALPVTVAVFQAAKAIEEVI